MSKPYIKLTEQNKKIILNFIGMCRMNGIELSGKPSMTFNDVREDIGPVKFDLFFRNDGVTEACWSMTVKADTDVRFHDDIPAKKGDIYCYLDSYRIETGSLELKPVTSKFNVFAF
ncbi:MAG: hypothetical protein IJ137_07485 [Eubacterium sp.]|nr:hypothetical protein [Eubacterium sp.]